MLLPKVGTERWEYGTNKFAIIFKSNIVVGIRLYKDSTMHFDKSGLGAAAMPTAYEEAMAWIKFLLFPFKGTGFHLHINRAWRIFIFWTRVCSIICI